MLLLLLTIATISFLFLYCDPHNSEPVNDPRELNWVFEILMNPETEQSGRFGIIGNSCDNVYTVGHVDAGNGEMWHYNGQYWNAVGLAVIYGGNLSFAFSLTSIIDFNSNQFYVGGDKVINYPEHNSLILHYDGVGWNEVITPDIGGVSNLFLTKANKIYAGGTGKNYLFFNGSNWLKDSVNIITPAKALMHITDFGEYNNNLYCLFDYQTLDATLAVHYFLKKNLNGWSIVDSFVIDQSHFTYKWGEHLKVLPDGELYNFGSTELQKFDGNSWVTILNERNILDVFGPNSSNMFAVGYPGKVFHFNGTDWYEISQLNNPLLKYCGVWFNGEEAFICGNTVDYPQKSIVWHGRK